MSGKMFRSGGSGYSVEGGSASSRSIAEIEAEKKDIKNQKRLREYRIYQKEKANFFKAIGKTPNSNSEDFYHFKAEYRKGKRWQEIAESILGEKVDPSSIDGEKDPNRRKGIQARLLEWYEKDDNMKN